MYTPSEAHSMHTQPPRLTRWTLNPLDSLHAHSTPETHSILTPPQESLHAHSTPDTHSMDT